MKNVRIVSSIAGLCLLAAGEPSLAAAEPSTTPSESAVLPGEPRGDLILRDALASALVGNPALAVFSTEVRRQDARAVQAGLLPNPQILVELENLGGASDRASFQQSETTVWLSQRIPVAGKVGKAQRSAELAADVSQWDYEATRLRVWTDATKAFARTLVSQRRVEILQDMERLAAKSVETVRSLARAGGASAVEQTRAEVELSSVRLRRQQAQGELDANRAALAATWGSVSPTFARVSGDLTRVEPAPPISELEMRVYETPDVARFQTELERQSVALSLEEARQLPDPTVSVGGRHFNDNGDTAVVLAFAVPLPVFDRNQGNVLAAAQAVSKARAQRASIEVSMRAQLRARHAALAAAYRQAETLRRETLPAAERTFSGAQEGHRNGFLRALDVIDAQRTLFELRLRQLDVLAAYHLARADVDRLTMPAGTAAGGASR